MTGTGVGVGVPFGAADAPGAVDAPGAAGCAVWPGDAVTPGAGVRNAGTEQFPHPPSQPARDAMAASAARRLAWKKRGVSGMFLVFQIA